MECSRVRREASWVGLSAFSKVREKASAMSSEGTWEEVCGGGVGMAARRLRRGAIETWFGGGGFGVAMRAGTGGQRV